VNDAGTPPPDWDSIFQQARRRMAARIFLVATIAAGGTMLLLGGGLQAEGAVSLPIPILNKNDQQKDKQQKQKHEEHKRHHQEGHGQHEKQGHHEKHGSHGQPKPPPKPCREEPETSTEEQYGRWDGGKDATGGKCPSAKTGN
jgi:hypothetical protein